jgi:hypothetical protein
LTLESPLETIILICNGIDIAKEGKMPICDPTCTSDLWTHADWIQVSMVVTTAIFGGFGAWFVYRQNEILTKQNEIMDKQNTHNEILLKLQSQRDWEQQILMDSKNSFKRTNGQRGLIQGVG